MNRNIPKVRTNDTKKRAKYFYENKKMNKILWARSCTRLLRRTMSTPVGPPGPTHTSSAGSLNMSPKFRPSDFQKFILVWTKKYKTKEEIPTFVSPDLIERSRSEARIKIANVLMLLTALASLGAILSGKAAAKRGESVQLMNQDFHRQYREDYDKKQAQNK